MVRMALWKKRKLAPCPDFLYFVFCVAGHLRNA
jgi:hypothetical protein